MATKEEKAYQAAVVAAAQQSLASEAQRARTQAARGGSFGSPRLRAGGSMSQYAVGDFVSDPTPTTKPGAKPPVKPPAKPPVKPRPKPKPKPRPKPVAIRPHKKPIVRRPPVRKPPVKPPTGGTVPGGSRLL